VGLESATPSVGKILLNAPSVEIADGVTEGADEMKVEESGRGDAIVMVDKVVGTAEAIVDGTDDSVS
jgi:hypothetical protein